MYLVELILKKWLEKKKKNTPAPFEFPDEQEDLHTNCEKHIYMPIDSTCDYLACKNCGHIIKKDDKKIHSKNQALYDNF